MAPFVPEAVSAPALSERQYRHFSELIQRISGISLGDNKKELLKSRLQKRLRRLGFQSYAAYGDYLRRHPQQEMPELLNAVSTNVTSFFRERRHFDFLTAGIVPELLNSRRQSGLRRLRIWSSACSSGEEVYSVIMSVREAVPDWAAWDIKVLGTDISTAVLRKAAQGVYTAEQARTVPRSLRSRYFDVVRFDGRIYYRVKDSLRQTAVFRHLNLIRPDFPFQRSFDVIFCRNVMIYFNRSTQQELVRKFRRYLAADGYLFIGHSESLVGICEGFLSAAPAVWKKVSSQ